MYQIKLDQFEGPLELLLNLIEEQKLDITRLSLAKVTDQYLEYLNKKENITLENLAEFLVVASRLILIKSKALLPTLELSQEEEAEIKDLEAQLALFQKFKAVSKNINQLYISSQRSFSREGFWGIKAFFCPPKNINFFDLKKNFEKVLSEIPVFPKLEEEMIKEVITLEEKINYLQEMLKRKIETNFTEIISQARNKVEIIVSFLAMLELVKQRIINVEQNGIFKEIKLKIKT